MSLLAGIINASERVIKRIEKDISIDKLQFVNEITFRYELTKELLKLNIDVENEWKHIDLIAHNESQSTIIAELKFYRIVKTRNINKKDIGTKGRVGEKNYSEFKKSYNSLFNKAKDIKINNAWGGKINNAIMIIVYIDRNDQKLKFSEYYDRLKQDRKYRYKNKIRDIEINLAIYDIKKEL